MQWLLSEHNDGAQLAGERVQAGTFACVSKDLFLCLQEELCISAEAKASSPWSAFQEGVH